MFYRIIFSIFLIFMYGAVGADAADSRYRVEILVLAHIGHDESPIEAARLEDFSDALDFLTPPTETGTASDESGADREPAAPESAAADREIAGLDGVVEGDDSGELACTVVPVAEMGPEMQEAWRRLRLSRPFRPLQYLAWEQPGTPPFPALRVHDLETVLTDDPWRAFREVTGAGVGGAESAVLLQQQQPAPGNAEPGRAEAGFGPLPSPIQYFRLDGRVRLVRTRFLHLDVLVETREPVFDPAPGQLQPLAAGSPTDPENAEPQPTSFLVHRLKQRRQVRTGRMEYFDGPVLGVLAFITDISDTVEEEPPTSP
jgi:hypothetical protein